MSKRRIWMQSARHDVPIPCHATEENYEPVTPVRIVVTNLARFRSLPVAQSLRQQEWGGGRCSVRFACGEDGVAAGRPGLRMGGAGGAGESAVGDRGESLSMAAEQLHGWFERSWWTVWPQAALRRHVSLVVLAEHGLDRWRQKSGMSHRPRSLAALAHPGRKHLCSEALTQLSPRAAHASARSLAGDSQRASRIWQGQLLEHAKLDHVSIGTRQLGDGYVQSTTVFPVLQKCPRRGP